MLEQLAPDRSNSAQAPCFYPCHPWESYAFAKPSGQNGHEQGKIIPLGLGGENSYPLHPCALCTADMDWFAKFSINVRLTNCVRKNAWYELDSAFN
ncbi:hypothetical protein O9929_24780 [Vibrio lentus]|nr:hypothetical protein [Vibrio lentus]